VKIREAEENDIETLSKLWYKLAKGMEQYSRLNELKDNAESESEEGFFKLLEDEDTTIFLLEVEDEVVGYMILQEGEHPSRTHEKYISIVDLFVEDRYRSQGYGTEMMEKAEEYAEKQECGHLKVSAEVENIKARKFYGKNGYKEKQIKYVKEI
jgi:ribosomal protein S18 acetylase RimI-like enzyme